MRGRVDRLGQAGASLLVLVVVAAVGLSACSGAVAQKNRVAPPATHAPAVVGSSPSSGRYAVGRLTETFVDRTRPTQKNGTASEKPERTLATLVLYPARGSPSFAAESDAPPDPGWWPLVIFSHGSPGRGIDYLAPLQMLASAGYVVAAPDFPLSKTDADGGASEIDVPEQSDDIGFLIDRLVAASTASRGRLSGVIDPNRIGIAGHSLGAITSLGAGFNACCADRRIKAVAEWAGIVYSLGTRGKTATFAKHRPLLIVHGSNDSVVPYRDGQDVYRRLGPPKYFVTLPGANHGASYVQGDTTPQARVTTLATLDFFDRYLKGDTTGINRLHTLIAAAGPAVATEQEQTR